APSLTYCYPDTLNSDNRTTNLGNINSEDNCDVLCVQEVANNFFPATSAKHANDGTHRLFLVEQRGMIWIYLSNFTKIFPPFLDWRPSIFARSRSYDERGLLDLAFHPEFRQNGRFYIYYTTRTEVGHVTRLSELTASLLCDENFVFFMGSRVILDIPQPAFNHNGGSILFYQGFLYLFTGDGGKGGDPYGNGQNLNVLLGKALRIDVDVANRSYGIPNDNPFLSNPNARPEIYAYGLRNPWKCTLDRGDPLTGIGYGRIFCGDVGQDDFEELDIMERGGNYGWNQLEGHACFLHSCDYVPPIHVYDHSIGRSITGGFVYRGCESPNLNGAYIFGDWDNGRLFYLRGQSTGWSRRNICMGSADYCVGNGLSGSYARYISSFAEDEKGEVYIISSIKAHKDMQGGRMYKIVDPSRRGSPTQCTQAPTQSVVFNPGTQFMAYEPITEMFGKQKLYRQSVRYTEDHLIEVQLVNERDGQLKRGRVEIRKPGGVWGTVCDDRWDIRDGHVVCKMAGFKAARRVFRRSHFGVGSGPIYLVDLGCTSNEISLLECVHRGWNQTNCNHFEDAGVLC
uniref:SRCR domain-containing protein n=1 Tax=Ciona savignyi TaxID=51511 RepID=H2ZES7_CIOSA